MSNPYGFVFEFPEGTDDVTFYTNCTYFNDKETASGIPADERTYVCSLPLDTGNEPRTAGSGIPILPWRTRVRIWSSRLNNSAIFDLVDIGPAKPPNAHGGADAGEWAYKQLGWDVNAGHEPVHVRIFSVAHLFHRANVLTAAIDAKANGQTKISESKLVSIVGTPTVAIPKQSHGFFTHLINQIFPHQGEGAESLEDLITHLSGIP